MTKLFRSTNRKLIATNKNNAKLSNDWDEIKRRAVDELTAMEATSKADALFILGSISTPHDDPECAIYQLLHLNEIISRKANFYSLLEVVSILKSRSASIYAMSGHETNRAAKKFVDKEWITHSAAYKGNKSSFTRVYVKRVFKEFDINVTEKQMREVWLKSPPPAGKPAG